MRSNQMNHSRMCTFLSIVEKGGIGNVTIFIEYHLIDSIELSKLLFLNRMAPFFVYRLVRSIEEENMQP